VHVIVPALVLVPLVLSCQLLLNRSLNPDPDPVDSGRPVDPCTHAVPPPPPVDAGESPGPGDLWFATQRIIVPLGEDAGVKPGLDLDDSCTCEPDLHDGAAPCDTPSTNRTSCDFDGGVDDALGATALRYAPFFEGKFDLAGSVNDRIATGFRTFLIFLSGYNGQANDADVGVAVVTSGGLYDPARCGDEPEQPVPEASRATYQHAPVWDGCDRWSAVPPKTTGKYPARKTKVTRGYVSNFTVVARLDTVSAEFFGLAAQLTNAVAVGTITPQDGGKYRVEGFITGRLAFSDATDLVGHTETVLSDGGKQGTCASPLWPDVALDLCAARDTTLLSTQEFQQPKNATCDAVTAAIGFVALSAQVSDDEFAQPQRVADCDAAIDCQ
jgi:hypothetical protein